MKGKGIIFALIAAAIGGIASEAVERGLNAADEKLQERKGTPETGDGDEENEDEETEDEETD